MKRLAIATALLLAVTACSRPAPAPDGGGTSEPSNPPPPASAPVLGSIDLSQDLMAMGTEPFWDVKIRSNALVLTRPDHPEISAPNPGPQVSGDTAVWDAKTADGKPLKVTLSVAKCSDGMSDRSYPLSAVVVAGGETLKGCADKADVLMVTKEPHQ